MRFWFAYVILDSKTCEETGSICHSCKSFYRVYGTGERRHNRSSDIKIEELARSECVLAAVCCFADLAVSDWAVWRT
jgi:hypothetical protein